MGLIHDLQNILVKSVTYRSRTLKLELGRIRPSFADLVGASRRCLPPHWRPDFPVLAGLQARLAPIRPRPARPAQTPHRRLGQCVRTTQPAQDPKSLTKARFQRARPISSRSVPYLPASSVPFVRSQFQDARSAGAKPREIRAKRISSNPSVAAKNESLSFQVIDLQGTWAFFPGSQPVPLLSSVTHCAAATICSLRCNILK